MGLGLLCSRRWMGKWGGRRQTAGELAARVASKETEGGERTVHTASEEKSS